MIGSAHDIDRRHWLTRAATLTTGGWFASRAFAQSTPRPLLPLRTTGLDHLSITVPDSLQAATFYGRIFDPQLFHERTGVQRYYVRLGASYLAFGPQPNATPFIDHIAAGVPDFDEDKFADAKPELTAAGLAAPPGGLPMLSDPDQLRLQLVNSTHGLFDTIMPGGRVHAGPAVFTPVGLDHITLSVQDLERASAHYRKLFGPEQHDGRRVWFKAGDGRLVLEAAAAGAKPAFAHFCVKVAPFDRRTVTAALEKLGAKADPAGDKGTLRFRDLHGLPFEVV